MQHRAHIHKIIQQFGPQGKRTVMAAKTLLKKWIHVLSIFIAIIQTHLLCRQSFLELHSEEPHPSLKKQDNRKNIFIIVCLSPP